MGYRYSGIWCKERIGGYQEGTGKGKGEIIKLQKEQVTASGRHSNLNPVHLQQITNLMEDHKALKNTVESIQNQSIQNHRLTGVGDETQEPSQELIDKVTEAMNRQLCEKLNECMATMEAAQEQNITSHRANMKTYAQKLTLHIFFYSL